MSNDDGAPARRPLVTVGLVTYRQERYVRESVRGVLAQTYSPLQIVICDDASPDSTFDVLREEFRRYRGDHKVILNKNAKNLGIGNFNELMKFADGELIVIAHGDDISCPDRVDRLVSAWLKSGASLVSSNGIQMSEDGRDLGPLVDPSYPKRVSLEDLSTQGSNFWVFGGALAWERRVFDVFGPLDPERSAISTDWIIPFRAALLGGIAIVDDPLVRVRLHPGSKSNRFLHSPDSLVHQESNFANTTIQYLYMLETFGDAQAKGLIPADASNALRQHLFKSIMRSAREWRLHRNRLLAQGRRARWPPVKA